ncbi:hypothetical protein [Metabacillus fastidiosus]|nr:hypothetical protein [Metabacillus fastidiosus]MEC2074828.1 hypothetical protein [Metabacillus fastidiosus]
MYGVCFYAEAFVYWLNEVKFVKRKKVARLIDKPADLPKKKLKF